MSRSIQGKIIVDEDGTVRFANKTTPAPAVQTLTDAVKEAKYNSGIESVSVSDIPAFTDIGNITYAIDTDTVTTCVIIDSILEEYATLEDSYR